MSTEANKAVARRIPNEIFNEGRFEVVDELFAPNYVEHAELPPGIPADREGVKIFAAALRAAFPDFRYTVKDVVAEDDTVVVHVMAEGTMRGEFAGMPATGKRAEWREMHLVRMADGKLTEHWIALDQLGMLQQLGVIPIPGA